MKNKQNNELAICGFAAVKELEKNNPERIKRLYFTAEKAPLFGGLCRKLATQHGIYNQVENVDLEKLSGTVHHQGVVAMVSPPEIIPLDSDIVNIWTERKEPIIYLDNIGNANNFGAIVRSAGFFGIKSIIIPLEESQTSVTTSTYRIAQGGMEFVTIFSVKTPKFFLEDIKDKIVRIGTDVHGTIPISKLHNFSTTSEKTKKPVLIILGNEETGISDEVKSCCDYLVTIPTPVNNLDSLNVAQAAAVIFYELTKTE